MSQEYTDHNPNITVQLTGENDEYCIAVRLGDIKVRLHVRDAIDLAQKLNKAACDWIVQQVLRFL